MSSRRYSILLLLLMAAALLLVSAVSLYLQPLSGDLTRIGWLSERQFGWQQPQMRFDATQYSVGAYTKPYDVVVIGDSFSRGDPSRQWQNYFVARTGYSLLTLDVHIDKFEAVALLGNDLFGRSPPKIVVIETVERELLNSHGREQPDCRMADSTVAPIALEIRPPKVVVQPVAYNRPTGILESLNPGYGKMFLLKSAAAAVLPGPSQVRQLELTETLFSNLAGRTLLVFSNDFAKTSWTGSQMQSVRCRLSELRRAFEASGKTRLVVMLAPDKLSAFRSHLVNPENIPVSRIRDILEAPGIPGPRLDLTFDALTAAGVLDLYLPNDTHWGWSGHHAAAMALADFLEKP